MKIYRLNTRQIDKLSDISSDVGLIAIASVVLPAVFDKYDPIMVLLGVVVTIISWLVSIILKR